VCKQFAPGYQRDEHDWIIFTESQDVVRRRELFHPECIEHPAKAPIGLYESIIEWVSEKDETIMDIMAGSGTVMVGALMARDIMCIEIEEGYQETLNASRTIIQDSATIEGTYVGGSIIILRGDCRKILPIPTNHIIFSPPYAQIMKMRVAKADSTRALAGPYKDSIGKYSANPKNVGNLNRFLYNQAMEGIYKLCYNSIIPPGTMTVILKDYMKQGERVYLSDWLIRVCVKMGFENIGWFKRYAPGSGFLKLWRSRGYDTVSDEDIIILRKNK